MAKTNKKKKDTLTISEKSLKSMDESIKNLEKGNVYGPVSLK